MSPATAEKLLQSTRHPLPRLSRFLTHRKEHRSHAYRPVLGSLVLGNPSEQQMIKISEHFQRVQSLPGALGAWNSMQSLGLPKFEGPRSGVQVLCLPMKVLLQLPGTHLSVEPEFFVLSQILSTPSSCKQYAKEIGKRLPSHASVRRL